MQSRGEPGDDPQPTPTASPNDRPERSSWPGSRWNSHPCSRPPSSRTGRTKSELRGPGRVALPLAFLRGADGQWRAKWLHLYLRGTPDANRVEGNRVSVATLVQGIVEREQLTVRHLVELMAGDAVGVWDGKEVPEGSVTYIGLQRPEGLHPDSRIVTLENLRDLIPE